MSSNLHVVSPSIHPTSTFPALNIFKDLVLLVIDLSNVFQRSQTKSVVLSLHAEAEFLLIGIHTCRVGSSSAIVVGRVQLTVTEQSGLNRGASLC